MRTRFTNIEAVLCAWRILIDRRYRTRSRGTFHSSCIVPDDGSSPASQQLASEVKQCVNTSRASLRSAQWLSRRWVTGFRCHDVSSSGVKRFIRNVGTPSSSDIVLCTRRRESSFVSSLSQGTVMHFCAVQFGQPCRDTSSCLCFTVAAPFGRDCCNLGRLRGKWMWLIVTSCDSGLPLGLRCEVPRMAVCLPQSMWRSDGMTGGHPLPFPFLCWHAGRSREKLRIACQDRMSWVAIWPLECWLLLTHENSCDLDSLGTGDGRLSAVHY